MQSTADTTESLPRASLPAFGGVPRDPAVRVLEPRRGWRGLGLTGLWTWRELLYAFVWRDIRSRYRQAALGVLWALIRPVTTMLIFSFILGRMARIETDGRPYALFSYTGLLAFGLFGSSVQTASTSVLGASGLLTKVYFPRLLLPISSIGAAAVDFVVALALLPFLLMVHGTAPTASMLFAPLIVVWIVLAAAGVGILLSGLVVRHRDFSHATSFLMQIWMYVTPVLYPTSLLPESLRTWAYLNPITAPVELFRSAILRTPVYPLGCAISAMSTAVLLILGLAVFTRVERHFADVI